MFSMTIVRDAASPSGAHVVKNRTVKIKNNLFLRIFLLLIG